VILTIPPTARVVKKQKCPITSLDTGAYILRSSLSPLAQIEIDGELDQAELDILVAEIEAARGVGKVQLPWISSIERYTIQTYKIIPIVLGRISRIEFSMVQVRDGLIEAKKDFLEIKYPAIYDSSFKDVYFRNQQKQFDGGIQATKEMGSRPTKKDIWNVTFHLTLTQANSLDKKFVELRGIHPFKWHPTNLGTDTDSWTCGEWTIEYYSRDIIVVNAQFISDGRPVIDNSLVTVEPVNCDALFQFVPALFPLNSNYQFRDATENQHYTFGITATINSQELDPYGIPGVAKFNGQQAFRIDASYDLRLNEVFSIELYIKPTTLSPPPDPFQGGISSTFLEFRNDSQNSQPMNFYFLPNGSIGAGWLNPSSPNTISAPGKILVNEWNYINISRDINNTFTVNVNGEKVIEKINLSGSLASNFIDWYIGGFKPSPPFAFSGLVGFMTDLRFTIGAVRDGLSKPVKRFAVDKCLELQTCNSNWFGTFIICPLTTLHGFADVSRFANVINGYNVQIVTTSSPGAPADPFGDNTGVAKLTVNGGYVILSTTNYFNQNNTSLGFWFYPTSHPGIKWGLMTIKDTNTSGAFDIEVNNDGSIEFRSVVVITSAPNVVKLNRWNFFRFRRGYVSNQLTGKSDSRCSIQVNNEKVLEFDRPDAINGEVFHWEDGTIIGRSSNTNIPGLSGYLSDILYEYFGYTQSNLAPIQKTPTIECQGNGTLG
jgi:hypothetical protein